MSHLLSILTFTPLIGALILMLVPKDSKGALRSIALAVSVVNFLISLPLITGFDPVATANGGMQFLEKTPWIAAGPFQMSYHVGIDGISLWLVILTTFIMPIAILSTYTAVEEKVKEYMICLLLLEVGMLGAFISIDLFLFYIFWEVMLIPMYFIIGIWGGKNRIYAAVKFFIYTMVGSLLMLVALITLYFKAGGGDFNLLRFYEVSLDPATQTWMFLAFALAFAIKVPMFPLHTWLPDAHTEAPTAGSVILAAVLLKMGTYGFVRFAMPLFPDATARFTPLIATLSVIGIVYASLVAMVQQDVKKLVAYSSVAHLGFVMLGVFALNQQGIAGGMLQMLNHGVSTGALFLIVGFIYERRHTRLISDFGGLAKQMPVFATIFMIVTFSSIGLPGTNGFVGEFLVLLGSFESALKPWAIIATSGVILSAVYMLWMFQRVMFGELTNPKNQVLKDLNAREIAIMVPLVALIFFMGIYPRPFIDSMSPSIDRMIAQTKGKNRVAQLQIAPAAAAPVQVIPAAAGAAPAADPHAGMQMPAAAPAAPADPHAGMQMPAAAPAEGAAQH
ncbi:NADH-quinone oxidoreductase subunit M [Geomesophilobacter sediminis]|uniref:NADH-quinone oxidoreductase subunit M n=1 Tax=Geomesophilobacter sediminis TaxID=2798584 RepID=A0A8J7M0M8_9BACT|nr:NADH-quinone oxidoreductase subunit M [Geomesophilobacter sediminis]MBJ6726012.1 NADH-quinone oxidoreductase subunit M [Geomesophilobacter sediminis]